MQEKLAWCFNEGRPRREQRDRGAATSKEFRDRRVWIVEVIWAAAVERIGSPAAVARLEVEVSRRAPNPSTSRRHLNRLDGARGAEVGQQRGAGSDHGGGDVGRGLDHHCADRVDVLTLVQEDERHGSGDIT